MGDILSDDAVVAFLRDRAPGLPTVRFDARAVTSQARRALRRRRRRFRTSLVAMASTATVYLTLALAGPVTVPGLGTVSVPGGNAIQALVGGFIPGRPPGPAQWPADVDSLQAHVLPVVERLEVSYYLLEPGQCRIFRYARGSYSDPECEEPKRFDAEAVADFDAVTDAVERSGVPVERIRREQGGIYIPLEDYSWQYNWEYVYLPDGGSPPETRFPGEEWTHIRGNWWFFRAHDD
jgi:hypothetical protein